MGNKRQGVGDHIIHDADGISMYLFGEFNKCYKKIPPGDWILSVVSFVCCQLEVFATS